MDALLSSENGVSEMEAGRSVPLRLASGPGRAAAVKQSEALFNTETPTREDFEFHDAMKLVALTGETFFQMPNAARHLNHYLDGGLRGFGLGAGNKATPRPTPLTVDVRHLLDDIPRFREQVEDSLEDLRERIATELSAGRRPAQLKGRPESFVILFTQTSVVRDWFFALGSFHFALEASLEYERNPAGQTRAVARIDLSVEDYYDWNREAVVLPFKHPETGEQIVISDKQMRRLHRVGLAREYPIAGRAHIRSVVVEPKT